MPPIPHSQVTHAHMISYLSGVAATVAKSTQTLQASREFKAIYKNSLAAYMALSRLGRQQLRLIRSSAESARGLPVLVACRQIVDAYAELRRFIELVTWFPFFADHRVEWASFEAAPWQGYVRYDANPIAAAAHREISYYFAYVLEKSDCRPTSVLATSVADLQAGYALASRYVHAGALVQGDAGGDAFDHVDATVLRHLGDAQRSVYRAALVVIAWANPAAVHNFTAVERSWFDWLLGKKASNAARSGTSATE